MGDGGTTLLSRSRVADRIFLDIREQILSGDLPRGAKLPGEKELCDRYGVSGPTVREAIRALNAGGFIEVRHGSGAVVIADSAELVAMALRAAVRLENVHPTDALDILSVLNTHAAALAARNATPEDLAELRDATSAMMKIKTAEDAGAAGSAFHHALVRASHNPLLEVLASFLVSMQVDFAQKVTGGSIRTWKDMMQGLQDDRIKLVEAIERRAPDEAARYARVFGAEAVRRLTALGEKKA